MYNTVSIKDVKLQLAKLCKQQRQSYQMSQEDLANALELSRYTIQKFEKGKNATLDTVLKIANHFNLLEDLHNGIKNINNDTINSLY